MRKINQEITDQAIIEEVLCNSKICRLGMIDDGMPYILPFNYGYKDKHIYIHCAPAGKKLDILRENPKVCFEIEEKGDLLTADVACSWSTVYRSIVGYGEVEIVIDFDQKQKALEIIMAHNGAPEMVDFREKQVHAVVVLKLRIDSLTGKQSSNWNKIYGLTE